MDEYFKAYEKYYLLRYGMDDDVVKDIIKNIFNDNFDDDNLKQLKKMIGILTEKKINIFAEREAASTLV